MSFFNQALDLLFKALGIVVALLAIAILGGVLFIGSAVVVGLYDALSVTPTPFP